MCSLILLYRAYPGLELCVAANRDEKLDRPALPPAVKLSAGPAVLCPTDQRQGGTWIGLSAAGLFVALTNRFRVEAPPGARSRGQLVLDLLGSPDLAAARARLAGLDPRREAGFHLVVVGAFGGQVWVNDGRHLAERPLLPGHTVITERSFGAAPTLREGRIRRALDRLPRAAPPDPAQLHSLLAEHDLLGLEGTCVHAPAFDYGTRSSTILYLTSLERPADHVYLHAEGPPCRAPHLKVEAALPAWSA